MDYLLSKYNIESILENHHKMLIYLGAYIRPLAFIPKWLFSQIILPYFVIKSNSEQTLRSLKSFIFNGFEEEEFEELILKWSHDLDKWFIFEDVDGWSHQNVTFNSHYLTNEHAREIKDARVPITVQICLQDRLLSPQKQQELAHLLNAKTVFMEDSGHMLNKHNRLKFSQSILEHLQNANAQN